MSAAPKLKLYDTERLNEKSPVSQDQLAEYFYQITNYQELYRIGKKFLDEANKGIKNFAFTSTGYKNSQQRTILGLCCFFDQNANYKIAVISDNLDLGVFNKLVSSSSSHKYTVEGGTDEINYKSFYHHFDFIDYSELINFYENHLYTKNYEAEIKKILSNYDLIFWDIPEMESMKKHPHFHCRISHFYESMTMIVSQNATSGKQVESIKNFFGNYNVNLNGVLFDSAFSEDKTVVKKKKFLGLF